MNNLDLQIFNGQTTNLTLKRRCNDNGVLIDTVLSALNTGWKDADARVRSACLRGAAAVCRLHAPARAQALPAVLTALSQGVDAQTTQSTVDNVPLAAIQGLSRLVTETETIDKEFERELLAISQKIRPFMNTECSQLRENSIRLFGIIAGRVKSESLVDQAVSSLPCFLLHLCDSNPAVIRASKFTLRQIFKTFNVKKSNDFVQAHLLDEGRLYLDEFLSALLRQLADEMPDAIVKCIETTVNYLQCAREEIKPHPPLLIGILYCELVRVSPGVSPERAVCVSARARLLSLLADGDARVRRHAAAALANMCLLTQHDAQAQ